MSAIKESNLYDGVEEFVKTTFSCFATGQQIGTSLGKVDIMGVRELGGNLGSTCEVIALEVKLSKAPFLASLGQAVAYSLYANRCYLCYNRSYSKEEIDVATQFGVGLIEIVSEKIHKVISTSVVFSPQNHYVLSILSKLKLFRCIICQSVYREENVTSINKKGEINLSEDDRYPGRLKDAIRKRTAGLYWLYDLAHQRGDERNFTYDRRLICKDCLSIFSSLIT